MKIATSELEHLREEVKNCHCIIKDLQKKREFVGLTDEEIDKAWRSVDYTVTWEQHRIDIAQAIEAKLKEKNGG